MELKSYQARTIQELKEFIAFTKTSKNAAEAYEQYWKSKGIIPSSDANIKPYNDSVKNAPHVCLKVPTAGGKTFIACSSLICCAICQWQTPNLIKKKKRF